MPDLKHPQMLETARELDRSGQYRPALEAYRRFLEVEPSSVEGWADFGGLLMVTGQLEEAAAACADALRLDRNCLVASINAAIVRMHQGHLDDAAARLRQILVLAPKRNDARLALAECLIRQRDFDTARKELEAMLQQDPGSIQAHQNLGHIFHRLGLWSAFREEIDRRARVEPSCAYVAYERGYLSLLTGDFAAGWPDYEARWRVPRMVGPIRDFRQPRWTGTGFTGKTLLLFHEQGFGDTVMFVRYAPLVKALGGRVLLEVQPELADLMATCKGVDAVIPHGEPLPPFDLQAPLLSLPAIFGTELQTIPAEVPYLDVPRQVPNRAALSRIMAATSQCTRIGLAWAGSTAHKNDQARSIPVDRLGPLAGLPDAFFFSFQIGAQQAPQFPGYVALAPWLGNFSDTAYALSGMDLVITVDTALAHLAGALGIPTLLLLSYGPDWRWMLGREESPWYPSMHIYRQPAPGDWESVIRRVFDDLTAK